MDSLGEESGGLNSINQRAMDIKKEADDLLNKATNGIKQLESEYTKLLSVLKIFSSGGLRYSTLWPFCTFLHDLPVRQSLAYKIV